MTLENYGSVWEIDHCLAIASFNLLDEKAMRKCSIWINLRPMYFKDKIIKRDKIDITFYLLQGIKARYFRIQLAKKDLIKNLIHEIYITPPKKIYPTN